MMLYSPYTVLCSHKQTSSSVHCLTVKHNSGRPAATSIVLYQLFQIHTPNVHCVDRILCRDSLEFNNSCCNERSIVCFHSAAPRPLEPLHLLIIKPLLYSSALYSVLSTRTRIVSVGLT